MTTSSSKLKVQWQPLSPQPDPQYGIPCARSSHGVSWVNDRLIVYGGEHVARTPLSQNQILWSCDRLEQWRCILPTTPTTTTQDIPPPRIAHAQAVHKNKDVYIFGGRAGIAMQEQAMNDLWKLDCSSPTTTTTTETWEPITDMKGTIPSPRSFHRMVCIGDTLYVFGGCGVHGRCHDLYSYHIPTKTWSECPTSQLTGRGGPTVVVLHQGSCIGVVAGFAGYETNDAQVYDTVQQQWLEQGVVTLSEMRPRSVCVAGSFPSKHVTIIFGGEVDPSDRGHEGAGGFANDVVVLDEQTGSYIETITSSSETNDSSSSSSSWPETRGWSAGDVQEEKNTLIVFGGLSGDDTNPRRLNDLWKLEVM